MSLYQRLIKRNLLRGIFLSILCLGGVANAGEPTEIKPAVTQERKLEKKILTSKKSNVEKIFTKNLRRSLNPYSIPISYNNLKKFLGNRDWSKKDTICELVYLIPHAIDWRQTRYIAKNPHEYSEINPLLKKHPSTSDVDKHFAITALGHAGISYLLPKKATILGKKISPRELWQAFTIGTQIVNTSRNFSIGVKIDW